MEATDPSSVMTGPQMAEDMGVLAFVLRRQAELGGRLAISLCLKQKQETWLKGKTGSKILAKPPGHFL